MKTKLGLLQRDAAEIVVNELPWHAYPAMILGYCFALVVALFVLFVIVDRLSERRWLRKKVQDIPDFVVCNCAPGRTEIPNVKCPIHGLNGNRNHTNTLSFAEFQALKTNHPSIRTPRFDVPEQPSSRGGGDTREGA